MKSTHIGLERSSWLRPACESKRAGTGIGAARAAAMWLLGSNPFRSVLSIKKPWVINLSFQFQRMSDHPSFSRLWKDYLDAVSPDLTRYEEAMLQAARAVSTRLGVPEGQLPQMILVPNPLQAPQIAEAVAVDERVFLIMAEPELESIVHEMLHHLLAPGIMAAKASIDRAYALWKPVRDDMMRMGYESADSWRRVFEENLVRAGTIWVVQHAEADLDLGTGEVGGCPQSQEAEAKRAGAPARISDSST